MIPKNPSLSKAVTAALQHVTPDSKALARAIDARAAAGITEYEHEHPWLYQTEEP